MEKTLWALLILSFVGTCLGILIRRARRKKRKREFLSTLGVLLALMVALGGLGHKILTNVDTTIMLDTQNVAYPAGLASRPVGLFRTLAMCSPWSQIHQALDKRKQNF